MPAILLVALLVIVAQGWSGGRSFAGRVAALAGRTSRPRMIVGWAAGTAITYGLSALVALALMGRIAGMTAMPDELRQTAWQLGLPADPAWIGWLFGYLTVGLALGITILAIRRWLGKAPIGLRYRSPAAAGRPDERLAAALLAISAGVSEELFFRLALPLLGTLVTGSGAAGLTIATAAFAAGHRHQGKLGIMLSGMIGAWLAYLYLLTGALWLVMTIHAVIDLHALVVRPWISGGVVVKSA